MKTMDPPLRTKGTYCDVQHTISGDSLPSEAHPYTPGSLTHLRRSTTHLPSFLPPYIRCVGAARRALICSPVTVVRLSSLDALLFPLRATQETTKVPQRSPTPMQSAAEMARMRKGSNQIQPHWLPSWLPLARPSSKHFCKMHLPKQLQDTARFRRCWEVAG